MTDEELQEHGGEILNDQGYADLDQRIEDELQRGKTMADLEAEWEYIEDKVEGQSEYYHSDEEAENNEGQKEDMKIYLSKLNKKIDIFVDSLKASENEIANQTKEEKIAEIVNENAENPDKKIVRATFHGYFKDQLVKQT